MGILRFPNAVSDVEKFIKTFATVYDELKTVRNFTHDQARDALIKNGLVSSSGAIGEEAVNRSVRDDRSRDPLYNQLKMYSELYRMLGWYKPGTQNTNFNFTELSNYVASSEDQLQMRIFEQCLLSIVFPNPLVENVGGNVLRPFSLILQLANNLDGFIFRDEIIVAILSLQNDRKAKSISDQINYLKGLRGSSKKLESELSKLAKATNTQINTLKNYTRFPLGGMSFTGWFERESVKNVYDKPVVGFRLTMHGGEKANQLKKLIDVRNEDLKGFPLEERGAFTLLAHYYFLDKCGFDISSLTQPIIELKNKSKSVLVKFNIQANEILYSPSQQSLAEEMDFANTLDEEYSK